MTRIIPIARRGSCTIGNRHPYDTVGQMINTLARLCMLCLLFAASAAQAQYLNMLGASPMSHFNEADNKLMLATIDKALADPAEGVPMAWKNDATPASGMVTIQKSYVAEGRRCRDLLLANAYKTLKSEASHTFCQDGAGQWKLLQ
jgi:surface antigen